MKIIPRALSAGLALAAVPAQAFVTYQDIVSAATNPDDLSRQALVTIFGDVVTNPLTASSNTIIGNLFRSKADSAERTELLVLITPQLVRPLEPDEVPPLPTTPKPFIKEPGGPGQGSVADAPPVGTNKEKPGPK